ncbi:hypothetical protein [Burkholderia ubonensis]|uniref:hypothetical protein n=1 Tax=Burkholderia ubonensis TaxID=101571 RepID=UPI0012F73F5A|nr:hypothetical protein [Burkholderia ubonensis]
MKDQEVIEALDELAEDSASRTKVGRLRTILSTVLRTQDAGVPDRRIVETLNHFGFDISVRTFQRIVLRLKREAGIVRAGERMACSEGIASADDNAVRQELREHAEQALQQPSRPRVPIARSEPPNLPEDWRTGKLTPEQSRQLTPLQRDERRKARDAMLKQELFPNPLRGLEGVTKPSG